MVNCARAAGGGMNAVSPRARARLMHARVIAMSEIIAKI